METTQLIESESLPERINKRDKERKTIIERRREEKQSLAVDSEQLDYFKDSFYVSCNKMKALLDSAPTSPISSLPNLFDKVSKNILKLKNFLSQSKIFLKVYDIRKAQETLQHLENELSELEIKLLPKKKFGFKNRRVIKKPSETKTIDVTDSLKDLNLTDSIGNGTGRQSNEFIRKYSESATTISGNTDERLIIDAENVNKNDVLLTDLTRCTVIIYGAPSTLHMINLINCNVLIGPVSSSVFAHNCEQSILVFACQQFRLHSSTDLKIYLHVTSRAIIEDCKNIKVAPYNWHYDDQQSHFNLAGLDMNVNNWDSIDDFNWLSIEKKSPNWDIIQPELRVKSWDL